MNQKTRFRIIGAIAILFGIVTIKAGGTVLFGDDAARLSAGDYIPLILAFNFSAGFVYVVAGAGLMAMKRWAAVLAGVIAVATLFMFVGLGIHIYIGGDYEMRTVYAMSFRSAVWVAIFAVAYRRFLSARTASWQGGSGVSE